MSCQVSALCKSVRYQLRNIGVIRKYLTQLATEKIVPALVSSRLDFCNVPLNKLPNTQLSSLQRLQNTAARIVTLFKRINHTTPVLQSIHWLPIPSRTVYFLLVIRCMHGSAPEYNTNLKSQLLASLCHSKLWCTLPPRSWLQYMQ